jgi:hypothetical protein
MEVQWATLSRIWPLPSRLKKVTNPKCLVTITEVLNHFAEVNSVAWLTSLFERWLIVAHSSVQPKHGSWLNTRFVEWTILRCLLCNEFEFNARKQFVIPKGRLLVHTIRFYIFQHSRRPVSVRLVDREGNYITLLWWRLLWRHFRESAHHWAEFCNKRRLERSPLW